jgi:hypothetical protein
VAAEGSRTGRGVGGNMPSRGGGGSWAGRRWGKCSRPVEEADQVDGVGGSCAVRGGEGGTVVGDGGKIDRGCRC